MNFILLVLSVAGILAALRQLVFAAFGLLKGGVDAFVMREVARTRAKQGDLTALLEAREWRRKTRNRRVRALVVVLFWAALLIAPMFLPSTRTIYAAYAVLWFIPRMKAPTVQ